MSYRRVPGFLAVTSRDTEDPPLGLRCALELLDLPPLRRVAGVWLCTWRLDTSIPTRERPVLLPGAVRRDGARISTAELGDLLAAGDLMALGRMLPPSGIVGLAGDGGLRVVVDRMGMRQVFHARGHRWEAASTSARLLATLLGAGLDHDAVLVQSQLGWQLGQRTLWAGVSALPGSESLVLSRAGMHLERVPEPPGDAHSVPLEDAVQCAADILVGALGHYLDDTESPVLQLTGGLDSRLVLAAIPPARRRGLRALTLGVPGSDDAPVARHIASRYGLQHRVHRLEGLDRLTPLQWFARVVATAEAHDAMLSPVAKAVTGWAEEGLEQGDRLGGLGGEIARGFYYLGPVRPAPVTRARSDRLALWRMMVNESVPTEVLHPRHRRAARETTLDAVHSVLRDSGDEWFNATDELYLRHRMARWAGLAESVAAGHRDLVNPLLDPGLTHLARQLPPADKSGGRFLARLLVQLDPELAALPLEGRAAPRSLASPGGRDHLHHVAGRARLAARKASQRWHGASRPPAGGETVAALVVEHLRDHPRQLQPLRDSGWVDPDWIGRFLAGDADADAATVAFLVNVLVAVGTRE